MITAQPGRIDRFPICKIQELASQLVDDVVMQCICDSRIGRSQDIVDIGNVTFGDLADPTESRARLGCVRASDNELAVQFCKLLFADKSAAGIDDIVRLLEIQQRVFRGRSLLAQFMDSILKPAACPTRRLIFRFKLVDDVGVCCRVRDLSSALRVKREEANFNDVGGSDPPRDESSLKSVMCSLLKFEFRRRTAAGAQMPKDSSKDRSKDAGPGSDKFRIIH